MTRFSYIFLFILLSFNTLFPQYNPGARQISLANSDVGLSNDVFTLFSCAAGLSQMNWRELGVYFSPAPFGFSEMANCFIAYNEPFSFGSFGIGGMTYGFELYRESKLSLAISHNFENKLFVGICFNYQNVSIKKYGTAGSFYIDISGLYYLTNKIRYGFFIHNINRATYKKYDDQIPVILNTGFSINILNNFTLNTSLEKDIRYNASISSGLEYDIIKFFTLRTGFSNEPSRYTAGIGIHYSYFDIDYAIFTHPDLGLTHQAGIIINFSSDEPRKDKIRKFLSLD